MQHKDPNTPEREPMAATITKVLLCLVGLAVIGAGAFYFITAPDPLPESHWANLGAPDVKNGEMVFWAGGCVSCHAARGAEGDAQLVLSGGLALNSPFGTFHVPNISPDESAGIGAWTLADLFAFLKTLPKSSNVAPPHELPFPFNIRLALGGWKFLYFNDQPRVVLANADDKVKRGQYLVEGLGHCGECHTPRDSLGGFLKDQWLAGAPNPEGRGRIPNITPGSQAVGSWSAGDIASYLETGFTPDFDSVGGSMVDVQKNIAHLPASDRDAIAAYLKASPSR
jgi:mono/diheme cytochrome c family protein